MSRTKQYERTDLVERAMDLFHRQGYNGTTTAELVDELGVNRKTMYAEFGSKQELFDAALDHYDATSLTAVLSAVESPDAGLDSIRTTFEGFAAASEDWAQGRGCLLCNTGAERASLPTATGERVDAYFERLDSAFRNPLVNAVRDGALAPATDIDALAAFFAVALVGVAVAAKGRADSQVIRTATGVALSVLDSNQPASSEVRSDR